MNTYLREFVQISINDWVDFIKYFTDPNLSNDELWRVNECPLVQIHLSVKKKDKKKKGEKKPKKEKKEGEEVGPEGEIPVDDEDDEDKNRVVYSPSPEECR